MGQSYNITSTFTGVDIYNGGGAAVAILSYTHDLGLPMFTLPMFYMTGMNGAAANITVEIWAKYDMNNYGLLYRRSYSIYKGIERND